MYKEAKNQCHYDFYVEFSHGGESSCLIFVPCSIFNLERHYPMSLALNPHLHTARQLICIPLQRFLIHVSPHAGLIHVHPWKPQAQQAG